MNFKIYFTMAVLAIVSSVQVHAQSCTNDYECNSLCCNQESNQCQYVNYSEGQRCDKASGESCISKEFCASSVVQVCKTFKVGVGHDGTSFCKIMCFPTEQQADCINDICVQKETPETEITNCEDAPTLSEAGY